MSDKSVMFGTARNVAPVSGLWSYFLPTPPIAEGLTVCGHPPRLILGEQLCRRAPPRFLFEVEVPERLPSGVPHDEACIIMLLDRPGRREAAGTCIAVKIADVQLI